MTESNGTPREPALDLSTVRIMEDGTVQIRTPDCGVIVLTPERAQEFRGERMRGLLGRAVLECRCCITPKVKDQ